MVMAASDENECRQMLYTAFKHDGPAAVRYPRGTGPGVAIEQTMNELPIGRGEMRRKLDRCIGPPHCNPRIRLDGAARPRGR